VALPSVMVVMVVTVVVVALLAAPTPRKVGGPARTIEPRA
jgi:hypothetical protein